MCRIFTNWTELWIKTYSKADSETDSEFTEAFTELDLQGGREQQVSEIGMAKEMCRRGEYRFVYGGHFGSSFSLGSIFSFNSYSVTS